MRQSVVFPAIISLLAVVIITLFGLSTYADYVKKGAATNAASALATQTQPAIDFANPARGAKNPVVTIVVFGDYECGACAQMETVLSQMLQLWPNQLRVVWKDLPNASLHSQAMTAALAARCAGVQDAFWEYHDRLFANQASLNETAYATLAEGLVNDMGAFKTCILQEETKPVIQRDIDEAIRLGVNATPFLFIGERRISGALDATSLESILSTEISSASKAQPPTTNGAK